MCACRTDYTVDEANCGRKYFQALLNELELGDLKDWIAPPCCAQAYVRTPDRVNYAALNGSRRGTKRLTPDRA